MIKAIVTDIDGTLLNSKGQIDPRTRAAIAKAHEKGYQYGLSTGRELFAVKQSLQSWGLLPFCDFIIASNGAELANLRTGKEERRFPLEGKTLVAIIEAYQGSKAGLAIPEGGALYGPRRTLLLSLLAKMEKTPFRKRTAAQFRQESHPKIMVVATPKTLERTKGISERILRENPMLSAVRSAPILLEFLDRRISKTEGLRLLGASLGISLEEMLCFGDADNDLDMIRNAGIGVAMGNASPALKGTAKEITAANDENGIGVYLETILLKKD